jgi:hypothetical protein
MPHGEGISTALLYGADPKILDMLVLGVRIAMNVPKRQF